MKLSLANRLEQKMSAQDQQTLNTVLTLYRGSLDERRTVAPNLIWHVPGDNPVAGTYHGFDEYASIMPTKMQPLTRWDHEIHNVMVCGNMVTITFKIWGERKGITVEMNGAHVLRVEEGLVAEGWGFAADQASLDKFYSA